VSFESLLRLVKELDPVQAGQVNRPIRQIDQNTRYIWEVLQAAAVGSTVYARRQTVEAEVKVGMAVYFDIVSQKFVRGLAVASVDNTTGVVATAESAQVWGIVATKINATLADILLFGVDTIDISQAVVGTVSTGVYYLSGSAPGKLVQQKPPVSIAVLRRTPDDKIFVMPQFVDFLDRHTHYQFDLTCAPAGTTSQPAENALHIITDASSDLPGWLPADDPVFEGKAPAGAVFGYNLSAHSALNNLWPPIPITNAALEWNKALSADVGYTGVPLGTGGLCILDRNGIWWLSNCYGDVPWPLDYDSTVSTSYSDSVGAECPRHIDMALRLYFTKVNFATDSAVVLSLRSNDARIKVRCYGDSTRSSVTGHLELSLDLNLIVEENKTGYQALKTFDPDTSTFERGPVVEGIYALSSNVTLSGDEVETRTIAEVARQVYKGAVSITVDPADTKELDVQLVRLDGAEEAYYGTPPLMYLEFVQGDSREYRGKINIPCDLAIPSPYMKLRFTILGRAVGTLPQLEFSGRIVPRPANGLTTPLTLPGDGAEFTITCVTVATLTGTLDYVEAESTGFAVEAGDTVFFTVRRSDSDGYAAALGILRQVAVVYSSP